MKVTMPMCGPSMPVLARVKSSTKRRMYSEMSSSWTPAVWIEFERSTTRTMSIFSEQMGVGGMVVSAQKSATGVGACGGGGDGGGENVAGDEATLLHRLRGRPANAATHARQQQ